MLEDMGENYGQYPNKHLMDGGFVTELKSEEGHQNQPPRKK